MSYYSNRRNNRIRALYYMYQWYYKIRRVFAITQNDFEHGTYRITKPGLYILYDDIVFNPLTPPDLQLTRYNHPAYSMGFFAAITIECDGVVLDLNKHSIQQSYEHYFSQRFFSILELANSPFVPSQGPGTLNTATAGFVSATNCLVLNGTLGLSSHSAVHGNNNRNVVLQNLCLQQFEVTGVQLNGVHNAHVENVVMNAISTSPLADMTFTFLQHAQELEDLVDAAEPPTATAHPSIDVTQVLESAQYVRTLLQTPFTKAAAEDPKQLAVEQKLSQIWTELTAAANDTANATHNNIPLFLHKFVNTEGIPDGSALYGVLINSSGVAVGELAAACPMAAQSDSTCRRSCEVSIYRTTVSNMKLHSLETIGIKVGDATIKDKTGALVKAGNLQSCPNWLLSQLRILLNDPIQENTDLSNALLGTLPFETFVANSGATFFNNSDVMAHVSKGIFGIRVENTDHFTLKQICVHEMSNTSTASTVSVPTPPTPLTMNSPDTTMVLNFTGSDIRGVFGAACTRWNAVNVEVKDAASTNGVTRAIELHSITGGSLCDVVADNLSAICRTVVHIQPSCAQLAVRNLQCKNTTLKTAEQALSELETLLAEANPNLRGFVRRWITVDPMTLSVECPCSVRGLDI